MRREKIAGIRDIFLILTYKRWLCVSIIALFAAFLLYQSEAKAQTSDILELNRQALQLYNQGQQDKSYELIEQSLRLSQLIHGDEHPYTLLSLNNLAAMLLTQGRLAEAEPLLLRGLEGREKVLGKDHPDTLFSVSNLASLYHAQQRWQLAEPLLRRALESRQRILVDIA